MLSANRLHEFVAIAEAGSVSEAARLLALPRATLSRRLSALEEALGVRLMHRQTRRLVLTPAGEELYRRAQRVVSDTEMAWAAVRQLDEVPRGVLRVSVADARMARSDLFVDFAKEFPEVQLEVDVTPRHVDLVAEGIDVAVRAGRVLQESLMVRRLGTARAFPVASPGYLKEHGTPALPEQLVEHACIAGFAGEQTPERSWPLRAGGRVPIGRRFATSGLDLRIEAAERGLGLALLPEGPITRQLSDGRLLPVLAELVGREVPLNLVFVDREFMPRHMRLFIDRAIEYFGNWTHSTGAPTV